MGSDLATISAVELLDRYRLREVSPVEATRAALDRIDGLNSRLNAFQLVDAARALADAAESERRWARGAPRGRCDGVPTSIKDLMLTRGWPTLRGSRTTDPDQPWDEDAPAVARLREHGAVLLGKTTTPEFGWKGVTDSPLSGITRNPWDADRTPGGSSGGAAVAVATGMGALAVGTDGGGSIRIPAGFTGIFGIKPTYDRVPTYPPSPFGTLSHAGPMTRTVADAALMLTVMAEGDPRDPAALAPDGRDYGDGLEDGVAGLRIAFSPDLGYATVDGEVAAVVEAAANAFADLGATVERADPGFDDPSPVFRTLWFASAAYVVGGLPADRRALLDPGLRRIAGQGAGIATHRFLDAQVARGALGARMGRFHETYDLLLTPMLAVPPFAAGAESPEPRPPGAWLDWSPFTFPFNMTGQPAASVPCGFTGEGLPVGLHVVGRRFDDALVLRAARAYERAHPFRTPTL